MSADRPKPDPAPSGPEPPSPRAPRVDARTAAGVWLAIAVALAAWTYLERQAAGETISYTAFRSELAAGRVLECAVGADEIHGVLAPPAGAASADADGPPAKVRFRTVRVDDPELFDALQAAGVDVSGELASAWGQALVWLLPLALIAMFWIFMIRQITGGAVGASAMTFGKSRARLVADEDIDVSFEDVAGCDEAKAELEEVVEFLRTPGRFTSMGAHIPKGVLLVGPPGTGKTLLARAIAGEAGVPFFSLSGSEFVEMFVGVGAARVRDLFQQAKLHAPCIVFIDELDAVGRVRGRNIGASHDERENTLNQLLVEMDGFDANRGVILLSATNRPDVLDPALLRPGRFDRQVVLDSPDKDGRRAILAVHARGKPLADDIDLDAVARATPAFSGADLANAMNEAALGAARRGASEIAQGDIDAAIEKVVAGPERRSRRLDPKEKRRVAHHEAGHAVVSAYCEHADPVRKISIVPRGRAALGYTLQLPTGDQHLLTRSELLDRIRGLLGGRAAEELILDEVSTGAENDLALATNLARSLIARFGMGESVRLLHCVPPETIGPLLRPGDLDSLRGCSERTASLIDEETASLLDGLYADARRILVKHRDVLERVASALCERETLDADDFAELLESREASESPSTTLERRHA